MTNNQLRIVIDHTGNQRGKGVKDCLISYGQRINFELLIFSLTLSMQISVSIDSDRTRNGQPPQILGAIGHPRYNGISELTDFVITGLHCSYIGPIIEMNSYIGPIIEMNSYIGPIIEMNSYIGPIIEMNSYIEPIIH